MEIHKANLEAQNTTRAILRPSATGIIPLNPHAQLNAAAAMAGHSPLLISAANASSQNLAATISQSILSQQQVALSQSSQAATPVVGGVLTSQCPTNITQSQPSLQLTAATNSCYTSNGSLMSTSGSAVTPNPAQQIPVSTALPMAYLVSKPTAAATVAAAQAAALAQAQAAQVAVNHNGSLNSSSALASTPQGVMALQNQFYSVAAQQAAAVQNGTDSNSSGSIGGNAFSNILQQDLHSVSPFTSQNPAAQAAAVVAAAQASGMNQSAIAAAQAAAAVAARTNTIPISVASPNLASYHVTPKLKSPAGMLTITSGRGSDKFAPY